MKEEAKKSPKEEEEKKTNVVDSNEKRQLDQEVEELFQSELGFSRIIELLIQSQKPIVGHNMIYDIAFVFNQFIQDMPKNYAEFANKWINNFPHLYDTKVLSVATNFFGKTDLQHLYYKCTNDKKLSNNLVIEFDKSRESIFGLYEHTGG